MNGWLCQGFLEHIFHIFGFPAEHFVLDPRQNGR